MNELLSSIANAFLLLIVIMGPFTGLPVFLKITQKFDEKKRKQAAKRAILFSAVFLLFFLFFGMLILRAFGISFEAFRIAGGIVLLIMGITYLFHISLHEKRSSDYATDIVVPFAMPLIIGPGAITTIILLVNQNGYFITLAGGALALLVYWIFLRYATAILRVIGHQGIEIIARIMGLLLMAIAIDMMKSGVIGIIQIGV